MAEETVILGKEALEEVARFQKIQQTLFPDGVIKFSSEEFKEYIQALDPEELTVRDALLSKLYASGMKVVPEMGVMKHPDTKEFAKVFSGVFSKRKGTAQQIIGFDKELTKLLENVNLDDRIDDVKSKIPKLSTFEKAIENVRKGKLPKGLQGTKLLNSKVLRERGDEIVQALARGLAEMPNGVTKDAILVGMMGSRFVDIQGFRKTIGQAQEASQERPYFDYKTGTQVNLDREGRKQLGPSKKLPSVTAEILRKRYDEAGETGELFEGVTRSYLNAALKKYVFSEIPQDIDLGRDLDTLTYTDIRRIIGNFVANSLGDPKAADEIISHEGNLSTLDDKISSVFEKYYAKVENPNSEIARTQGLLLYEKELAKGLGATDPMDFANKLGLGANPETKIRYLPEFTAPAYPEVDAKIDKTGTIPEEIILTPEQKEARARGDVSSRNVRTAKSIKEEVDIYKNISKEDIKSMEEKKALEKTLASSSTDEITKQNKLKQKADDAKSLNNILQNIADEHGMEEGKEVPKVEVNKATGKLKFTDTLKGLLVTGLATGVATIADKAMAAAVPLGKAAGALGPFGGPALEGAGIAATAYDINRLKKIPSEQFVPEQVRSFLDEPEFVQEGESAKAKRIATESVGLVPGGVDPSLGQAGRMLFPTREEALAKQMIEQEEKEKWAKIDAEKGQSFLRGSGI